MQVFLLPASVFAIISEFVEFKCNISTQHMSRDDLFLCWSEYPRWVGGRVGGWAGGMVGGWVGRKVGRWVGGREDGWVGGWVGGRAGSHMGIFIFLKLYNL